MRKQSVFMVLLTCVFVAVLAGCSTKPTPAPSPNGAAEAQKAQQEEKQQQDAGKI